MKTFTLSQKILIENTSVGIYYIFIMFICMVKQLNGEYYVTVGGYPAMY